MSRTSKHRKHNSQTVISVDSNFMPMQEISARKAITALVTGRALVLDPRTWARLGLQDAAGIPLHIIVYVRAKAIPDAKVGFGRDNRKVLKRDGFLCQYDDCPCRATTVDHIIPQCQGGRTTWMNLVAACQKCNQRKGGRTPAEAGMVLKGPVRSPKYHLMKKFEALVRGAA